MKAELMNVTGMTCGGCTSKLTHALKAVSGVGDVRVSLSSGEVMVQYDDSLTSIAQLRSAVASAGYGIGGLQDAQTHSSKRGCCG